MINLKKNKYLFPLAFICFCIFLAVLETAAYKISGIWSMAASRIWMVMGFFYLLSSLYLFFNQFFIDIKKRNFLGLIAIIIACLITLYKVSSFQSLNHESTQQLAAAFENIKKDDFHYPNASFLGYPSRQYLITALPSFILGKSPLACNLGYAFPFILGIFLFYVGLKKTLDDNQWGDILSSLAIISLTTSPYIVEFLLHFEQATLPLAFSLQAIGWYLALVQSPSFFKKINLIWIGTLLSTTYTPGLSSWVLLLIMIGINIFRKIKNKHFINGATWACCFLVIISFGINSFFSRDDLSFKDDLFFNLGNKRTMITASRNRIDRGLAGYKLFFFSDPKSFLGSFLALPVYFYLAFSFLGLNGLTHFLISLWSILTVGFSVYLVGYADPPPTLSIHRAMIVVPVIVTGLASTLSKHSERLRHFSLGSLYIFFVLAVLFSFKNLHQTIKAKRADIRINLVADIIDQSELLKRNNQKIANVVVFSKRTEMASTGDFLKYFFPEYKFTQKTTCQIEPYLSRASLFYSEDPNCAQRLSAHSIQILPGQFVHHHDSDYYEMIRAVKNPTLP